MHRSTAMQAAGVSEVTGHAIGDQPTYRSNSYEGAMQRLARFARDDTVPILLQGESGTGKTLLARRIHELSPRSRGPFHHVDLTTVDDGVAGSELFGHLPGAFTDARQHRTGLFASANNGTAFLDELGKAALKLQGKLLRFIEYREMRPVGADRDVKVNVRIVAATNVDLACLVDEGLFLPDLRARLAFRIRIPPLRERRADIPALVRDAIDHHAQSTGYGNDPPGVDEDLVEALKRAPWPDNLRELDTTIHMILLEADGAPVLTLGHCRGDLSYLATGRPGDVTLEHIEEALKKEEGNVSAAARLLGIDRKTLRRKRSDQT